jgi:hypothetical protein
MKLASASIFSLCIAAVAMAQTNALNSSGNVGIGTTSPTSIFEVFTGAVTFRINPWTADLSVNEGSGGWARDFRIYNSTNTTNRVHFGATGSSGSAGRAYWVIGDSFPEATAFQLTNGIHLLNNGNVGVGIANPDAALHINGGAVMTAGWNRTAVLKANYPVLGFNGVTNSWAGIGYDPGYAMRFWIGGNSNDIPGSSLLAMSINPAGNVGIGVANPVAKLVVASPQTEATNAVIAEFSKDGGSNSYGSAIVRVSRG